MKKICTLVSALLLLFVANVRAQVGWEFNPTVVDEILAGEENYYAIQEGFDSKGFEKLGFLNSAGKVFLETNAENELSPSCIFNFIEVSTFESHGEMFQVFIMKNIDNNLFLSQSAQGNFTASPSEAFQFTARKAVVGEKPFAELKNGDWFEYSNAVHGGCAPCIDAGAWVICSPSSANFLAFKSGGKEKNPGWNNMYNEATNWRIYKANTKALPASTVLENTIKQYFIYGEPNEIVYPVGDAPGCISAELLNELSVIFKDSYDAVNNSLTPEQTCLDLIKKIKDIFDRVKNETKPMSPGYFTIKNAGSGLLKVLDKACCKKEMDIPTEWNLSNANFIWKVVPAEEEGKFYLKNVGTEKFLGSKPHGFKMTNDSIDVFTMPHRTAKIFYLNDGVGYLNVKSDGSLTHWSDLEGKGNHWIFEAVDNTVVDSLSDAIHKVNMVKNLKEITDKAQNDMEALAIKSGMTMNGRYSSLGAGMIKTFNDANCLTTDNPVSMAFDRDIDTWFHTKWKPTSNPPVDANHWVQMDLGEPVSEIYLKMTKRINPAATNPTRIQFTAAEGDSATSQVWDEVVGNDTVIYTYPSVVGGVEVDSMTSIQKFVFDRPIQHLRFTATETVSNKMISAKNSGPFWNISEFRIYNAANCVHNLQFDMIPQNVLDNLKAAIAKAKEELSDTTATQATMDWVKAAVDSMWSAYPEPSILINAMEHWQTRIDYAKESDTYEVGSYKTGAKAAFQAIVDVIKARVEDKTRALSLNEIEQGVADLFEGFRTFQTQLYLPEEGIYRLKSQAVDKAAINGTYISSVNADPSTPVIYAYQNAIDINERWNTLWEIKKNEENKFSFRNLATGLYINNPYQGLSEEEKDEISLSSSVVYSKEPTFIELQASAAPGHFLLTLDNKRFMNASSKALVRGIGRPMAIWSDFKSSTSRFSLEPVTDTDLEEYYSINCEEKRVQIFALPIDVCEVGTSSNSYACKVLGINGDKIILEEYAAEDTIPAGTPFIIQTNEGDVNYTVYPIPATLEDLSAYEGYCYEKKVQNGLVSAPVGFDIEPGYGIPFIDKITVSMGGEHILGGTGFFNNELPKTTEEGPLFISVNGEISGVGTAVENVIVKNTTNDVYTISGVKVRQNVSTINATKGLPKGIYIVGGKKTIVK